MVEIATDVLHQSFIRVGTPILIYPDICVPEEWDVYRVGVYDLGVEIERKSIETNMRMLEITHKKRQPH